MEWSFIYIVGAVNCCFLGIVILNVRGARKRANRLLAGLFFIWSYGFFYTWVIETELYRDMPHVILAGAPNTFLMGPALYLYVMAMVTPAFRHTKAHLWHALPFATHALYLMPFYYLDGGAKLLYWETGRSFDSAFFLIVYLQLAHLLCYLVLILRNLRRHRARVRETYSTLDEVGLSWLSHLIIAVFVGLGLYGASVLWFIISGREVSYINRFTDAFNLLIIHLIGYRGLIQADIFRESPVENPKYEKSALTDHDIRKINEKTTRYIEEEKAYLDSELTLQKLSEKTDVPSHRLSQALNQGMGMNFFDFVNRYRVRHACELIRQSRSERRTFLDIAFSSGFNSKSSFNAVFREYCGMTPSQYKKSASDSTVS